MLRPGGHVALAVWDSLAANPWASRRASSSGARADAAAGGVRRIYARPFGLGDPERLRALLGDAGFTEVSSAIEVVQRHDSFDVLLGDDA